MMRSPFRNAFHGWRIRAQAFSALNTPSIGAPSRRELRGLDGHDSYQERDALRRATSDAEFVYGRVHCIAE
jgi:hypothetical protein